jgi:hypothetical protein
MWASSLSGSVRLGREARTRRQYRYSASKPLCYWFKGGMSPSNAARQTGLGRSTFYRDIQARDHA